MEMSARDYDRLTAQLHRDEGTNPKNAKELGYHEAYLDSVGVLTVGYGHNCEASPVPGVTKPGDRISDDHANELFEVDLDEHINDVLRAWPWVEDLDGPRQGVLFNMGYNMGTGGLGTFKNTLAMIKAGDYRRAAYNMLQSKWALQVKMRANRLAKQMETGEWQ